MKIQTHSVEMGAQQRFFERLSISHVQEQYQNGQRVSGQTKTVEMEVQRQHSFSTYDSSEKGTENTAKNPPNLSDARAFLPGAPLLDARLNRPNLAGFATPGNLAQGTHSTQAAQENKSLPPKLAEMVRVVEEIMTRLTQKEFRMEVYGYERSASENGDDPAAPLQFIAQPPTVGVQGAQGIDSLGQAGQYEAVSLDYQLQESMTFKAQGRVTTADGQRIEFDFASHINQSHHLSQSVERAQGLVMRDPLVISFAGQPAQLSVERVQFDLESNQQLKEIPLWQAGSGYLVLDRNQNHRADDGSELFGTQSGNGFADLALHDQDDNGWIDENDAVFSQLSVWHTTPEGYARLDGLATLGIGAIYLDSVLSPYEYRDQTLQSQAKIQRSGLVLMEDGQARSIQQIDLAV
ncbi:hypothetical protein [Thiomicrorhabdus aquaedulcis]|uniref:hypothetical protein n=1 Tax=Thiomicrorhabdus aquaedulcis TaxID=2211106 RepID=UPI000FDBD53D|nr:hypothetical protein [Thiomicrorhabdus aquaedulcis]